MPNKRKGLFGLSDFETRVEAEVLKGKNRKIRREIRATAYEVDSACTAVPEEYSSSLCLFVLFQTQHTLGTSLT